MKNDRNEVKLWQSRLEKNLTAYEGELEKMRKREAQYKGDRTMQPLTANDKRRDGRKKETSHVWNITAENIESEIDSSIPMPKVTPCRKEDEGLARMIENLIRNELDRMPLEEINDEAERITYKQGGVLYLPEWDASRRSHNTVGENTLQAVHPMQFIPQDGVTSVDDMDYYFWLLPVTKGYIRRRYGADVSDLTEEMPEIRSGEAGTAEDMVTLKIAEYRNEEGGIGRFAWVGETELESLKDCQARILRRCRKCGMTEADSRVEELDRPTQDGEDVTAAEPEIEIPYYKPDIFPAVLRRNVTAHGTFLGESDCDKIADQQNTINRLEQKIIDRMVKAGTKITMPDDTHLRVDPEDNDVWYVGNAANASLIGVRDFTGNLQYELAYMSQVYEESRRVLGITDSFQGRRDSTAQSGKAKEFAAAQSAGRLESKRVMKKAAFARIFERIFKNQLAYCDEKRPVHFRDEQGNQEYEEWNSYAFLRVDEAGELYWNDQFIFSCDDASGLAANREAMWQETTAHLQSGAYGNPGELDTLILYWTQMEELHYPGAGKIKGLLEQRRQEEILQQQMMMQQQMAMQAAQQQPQM